MGLRLLINDMAKASNDGLEKIHHHRSLRHFVTLVYKITAVSVITSRPLSINLRKNHELRNIVGVNKVLDRFNGLWIF